MSVSSYLLPILACIFAALCVFNLADILTRYLASRHQAKALQTRVCGIAMLGSPLNESYQDFPELKLFLELARAAELDKVRETPDEDVGIKGHIVAGVASKIEGKSKILRRTDNLDREECDRQLLLCAGLLERVDARTLHKLRRFCMFIGAALSGGIAVCLSPALAPIGVMLGAWIAYRWPNSVLKRAIARRKASCEKDLPFMLDIVALCVQTGMSFDAALATFCRRFDSALAHDCEKAYLCYLQGAKTREESLEDLAAELDMVSFDRFVEVVTQALRFGAPLGAVVGELADEIRKEYRATISEHIAKAPVRMLIPTGTLILPAMLILVMGPVVLNIVGEMM